LKVENGKLKMRKHKNRFTTEFTENTERGDEEKTEQSANYCDIRSNLLTPCFTSVPSVLSVVKK